MGASVRYAIHVNYVIAAALAGGGRGARREHRGAHRPGDGLLDDFRGIRLHRGSSRATGSVIAPFFGALIFGAIHTIAYDVSPTPGS